MYLREANIGGSVVPSSWETISPVQPPFNLDSYAQRVAWPAERAPAGAASAGRRVGSLGAHPDDQKMGLLLLVVGVALLAYFLGKSNSPRRNPPANYGYYPPMMPPWMPPWMYSAPPAWPAPRRPRRHGAAKRRAMRRRANHQPRDEYGRFVPA